MDNLKGKLVLIGMPGCGKSTIGKMLAEELEYSFYDMDEYIEEISSKSIKELFEIGEEEFRNYESKACEELSKKRKAIISCGGGVIKRVKNIDVFKNESIIVFIDRPVENIILDIDTDTRPLLAEGKERLYNLFEERYDLYKKYSNIRVVNDRYLEDAMLEVKNKVCDLTKL